MVPLGRPRGHPDRDVLTTKRPEDPYIVHPVLPAWATWGNQKTLLNAVRADGILGLALALLTERGGNDSI